MEEKDTNIKLKYFGIPKILPFIKKYRGIITGMIIMGIVASLIDSIYPLFIQYALNHFVALKTLDTMGWFVLLFLGILIFQVIINFVSVYWAGKVEMSVDRDLRSASFNHLQELSFAYFNQNNVGYVHARVMSDTSKIGELVAWRMMDIVWNGSYLIFILMNMLLINVHLALYILALVPIAFVVVALFQKELVGFNRKIREINSKITGNFNEGITGAKSIKTLVVEDRINEDFQKDTIDMQNISVRSTRYSAAFTSLVTMMGSVALAIVLWQGGQITLQGVMLIGTLSVFMNYAINMLEPIQSIITTISALIAIQVNIERYTKLLETKSDVADTKEVIAKYGDSFHPKKENWEPIEGNIEFKDVSFQYPDGNEMVLEHFNLKVPQGTNVAIVGETGAGKSTLVNLVCRFFEPTKGQVLIDGKDCILNYFLGQSVDGSSCFIQN